MKPRQNSITVNVFPFLSVLCCLIGVLILLMLILLGTRVVDIHSTPPISLASQQGTGVSDEEYGLLQAQLDELARRLAQREEQLAKLLDRRDELQALLALKQSETNLQSDSGMVDGVQLVDHPVCELIPDRRDGQTLKRPIFIEVDLDGFLLQPGDRRFSTTEVPGSEEEIKRTAPPTTPFQTFLQDIYSKRKDEYLIFLVRPNGVKAFKAAQRYLVLKYPPQRSNTLSEIDLGWEPFSEDWKLLAKSENQGAR